jgi:hypothetical protein
MSIALFYASEGIGAKFLASGNRLRLNAAVIMVLPISLFLAFDIFAAQSALVNYVACSKKPDVLSCATGVNHYVID